MLAELLRAVGPLEAFALVIVEGQFLPAALLRTIDPGALLDLAGIAGAVATNRATVRDILARLPAMPPQARRDVAALLEIIGAAGAELPPGGAP